MEGISSTALRVVLVIVGGFFVFVGLNIGFGGIQTLGLQGTTQFLTVTQEARYLVQDNHVRFLGGVFGALGLFLILGASNLKRYQAGLRLAFALTFIGGLARFTSQRPDVVFGPDVLMSVLGELVLMPILYVWLSRTLKSQED
jgi:hypothetical protein